MRKIDKFIEEISRISNQINLLENKYIESVEDFNGNEFEGQSICAVEIENLILMLTHELSSQIEFGIEDLKTLLKYIEFRKTFKEYSSEELLKIIDNFDDLNIKQRRKLIERKEKNNIAVIKSKWNKTFQNRSYIQILEKLRVETPNNGV